ncbi:hypothetical protein [Nocardia sp. NBC_00403]|uniref:hypothetical protein n=1 Tax=Nocardia sp. NBC_00403 TaxID=2975990 RepID=UPI002E1D7AB5
MNDEEKIQSFDSFDSPDSISEITDRPAEAKAPSLPSGLLTLPQLLDGCTTTLPTHLQPFANQLEGGGWRYSRTVEILSYYYISTEQNAYLDAWTSRSDKPGERCDGGYINQDYANYNDGRWVFCFRTNGTPPSPFTHSVRLVSLRDGRLEYMYPGRNTVFPSDIFGRRGNPEMDLYEVVPKVFIIGSRHNYTQTGNTGSLGRYGYMRPVPPPENHAYIKWDGMATMRESLTTTVDRGWCLQPL